MQDIFSEFQKIDKTDKEEDEWRSDVRELTLLWILRRIVDEIRRRENCSATESAKWDYAPLWIDGFVQSSHPSLRHCRCYSRPRRMICRGARRFLLVQRCCPLRFDSMLKLQQLEKKRIDKSTVFAENQRRLPLATSGIPHDVRRVPITELIDPRSNPIDVNVDNDRQARYERLVTGRLNLGTGHGYELRSISNDAGHRERESQTQG